MKRLICWFKGHIEVSLIKDLGSGRLIYTHDYCQRCKKILRLNYPGYLQDIWVETYKNMPTEFKNLYDEPECPYK